MSSPRRVLRGVVVSLLAVSAVLLSGCSAVSASSASADVVAAAAERPLPSTTAEPASLPVVDAISATSGTLQGGETVTITGSSLQSVTDVTFGGASARSVALAEDGSLTVVVPHAATYQPGVVDVAVLVGDQQAGQTLSYEYVTTTPVDAQMQYAFAHWNDYNTAEWGDYNVYGGDCANFVSQTLIARGWQQTSLWYNNSGKASSTWSYVPSLDNWLKSDTSLGVTRLSSDQRDRIKVGDIAIFSWDGDGQRDHTMIVSDVVTNDDGSISIKLVGHNIDYDYRDLDETLTEEEHPNATAWFYSIP